HLPTFPTRRSSDLPERLADDRVRLLALDVDDESDATGVVLVTRIVQALGGRLAGHRCRRRAALYSPHPAPLCEQLHDSTRAPTISHPKKLDGGYQLVL